MTPVFRPRSILNRLFVNQIIERKRISWDNQVVLTHIYQCLDTFNLLNSMYHHLTSIRDTSFSYQIEEHVELLHQFWTNLKPGSIRKPYVPKVISVSSHTDTSCINFMSTDWSEVGFQSMDPSTDFRGMGLLGLAQLHYFSLHRSEEAKEVLRESNHERRFFPFAATGINISFFVFELMQERRLDSLILHQLSMASKSKSENSTTDRIRMRMAGERQASTASSICTADISNTWTEVSSSSSAASSSPTLKTPLLLATTTTTTTTYQSSGSREKVESSSSSSVIINGDSNCVEKTEEARIPMIIETTEEPFPTELFRLGESYIHDIYCDVYIDFNRLWRERDPPNIMSFQSIFEEIKAHWRKKLPVFGN